jgi:SP family facilitated glucose transporter-like MFS transporter 8
MNMMDDCETSLQVLRGFDADITAEVNDIKACVLFHSSRLTKHNFFVNNLLLLL